MIHLCMIYNQTLWETDAALNSSGIHMPISVHESAYLSDDRLFLPSGWRVKKENDAYENAVSLLKEGNYELCGNGSRALLMVRMYAPDALENAYLLTKAHFTVGRASSNEISYRDCFLSSEHGVFSYDRRGVLSYEDTSTNGTFVNGRLIQGARCELKTGDKLEFPPLLQITVMDGALSVRFPKGHANMALREFREYGEACRVAFMVQPSGNIHHVWVERNLESAEALLKRLLSGINHADAAHLMRKCGITDLKTGMPVSADSEIRALLSGPSAFIMIT